MSDTHRSLAIGELADRAGMSASRLRYYERRGLIDPPPRHAGKRRYHPTVLRRLAIIEAAQRVGFSLEEIKDLLGSRNGPAHERLRRLALRKLPDIDELIARATTVQALLRFCGDCHCKSIDECKLLEERTTLLDHRALHPNHVTSRPSIIRQS
jgi:MerR family redox-sensitive transcriptional activator SoxR